MGRDMAAWPGRRGLSRGPLRVTSGPFGELLPRVLRSSCTRAVKYHSLIGSIKTHIKLKKPGHGDSPVPSNTPPGGRV